MTYADAHARDLPVPPEAAWQELAHVGGDPRWWTPYLLWQLRGLADPGGGGDGRPGGGRHRPRSPRGTRPVRTRQ